MGVKSEKRSYGIAVNSFYKLETAYADPYRSSLGIKSWHKGPTFLSNNYTNASSDEHECLKRLNSKMADSVMYVSFGSVNKFNDAQILGITLGLEASGQQLIWVVKKDEKNDHEGS